MDGLHVVSKGPATIERSGRIRYNVRFSDEMIYGLTFDLNSLTLGEAIQTLMDEKRYDLEELIDARFDCYVMDGAICG